MERLYVIFADILFDILTVKWKPLGEKIPLRAKRLPLRAKRLKLSEIYFIIKAQKTAKHNQIKKQNIKTKNQKENVISGGKNYENNL